MSSTRAASPGPEAVVATGLTKWFGEGGARMAAVNGVGLVAEISSYIGIRKVMKIEPFEIFRG